MEDKCEKCGEKLKDPRLTHCSEECLFSNLKNSKSITDTPIETWSETDPWI